MLALMPQHIFWLFCFLFIASNGHANIYSNNYHTQISRHLHSHFHNCTLIIFYNDLHLDESSQEIIHFYKNQDKFLINLSLQNLTEGFQTAVDVHQLRGKCTLSFVPIQVNLSQNKSTLLYAEFRKLVGVIKTDEDFFIFHSLNESSLVTLFSNGSIASGIRNKVGIWLNPNESFNSSSPYYTTCFFCFGGVPSVHTFSISNLHTTISAEATGISAEITMMPRFQPGHELFPDMLDNFHGKTFTVSVPTLARWLIDIRETSPGHWDVRRGVMQFGLLHVMYKYNFSGLYFPSTGSGTGYMYANGTWVGTVGDVVNGKTELAQTTGQILARNKVVSFSFPVVYEWLTFRSGEPHPHYSWKSVYWPFRPLLWLSVIGSGFLALGTFTFLLRITKQEVSLSVKVTYLLRTLLEQDAKRLETSPMNTTRMFMAFWLIFALLITTSYRSKLVSVLAFPLVDEPPKTFESLAKSTKFQIALQYIHGAAYSILKTSTNPTFQKIFKRMELEENDARCFQLAIQSRYSCISWDSVASFVSHKNLSDKYGNVPLIKAQDTTSFIVVGIIFPKGSVLRRKFDSVLSRAMDFGLAGKWKEMDNEVIRNERKVWEKATNRSQVVYDRSLNDVLTLQNLSGTFYISIVGCIVAVVAFAFEAFIPWWRVKFKREWFKFNEITTTSTYTIAIRMIADNTKRTTTLVDSTVFK